MQAMKLFNQSTSLRGIEIGPEVIIQLDPVAEGDGYRVAAALAAEADQAIRLDRAAPVDRRCHQLAPPFSSSTSKGLSCGTTDSVQSGRNLFSLVLLMSGLDLRCGRTKLNLQQAQHGLGLALLHRYG
jgi:hypothetical protein